MCFLRELGWDLEVHAEPMRRPTGTKGLADFGGAKLVRGRFLEGWTRQIGRRIDLMTLGLVLAGRVRLGLPRASHVVRRRLEPRQSCWITLAFVHG